MNEINNLILQAVDTVVNARLQKQQKDTTIIAQIYENSDAVFGKYVIKYQNNYFDAESNNTEKIYRQNENVYVLLPKGDLNSPQKFILGAAKDKNAETPYVEITDPNQRYELVGPPIINLLWPESDSNKQVEYQIPGYNSYKRISTWPYSCLGENQSRLLEYSKQYSYLQFSADFKYNPALDISQCGNYGIEIGFFTNANSVEDVDNNSLPDEKNIITYRFDTESMYGNPFVQHNYLNRAITIQCDKGMIYDLAYITIFSEGFSRTLADTKLTEIDNSDIFIKNINIQFAELRTATDDYYANIVTPYGVYISESLAVDNGNKKYIQLKPQMKYKGKLLNDVTFLWFEKNPQSDTTSENYHILGGRGWDLLAPNGENGDLIYSETDTNWFSKQIKLVAKYTDNIIREKEITIFKSSEHFVIGETENPAPGKIQLYLIDADGKAFVLSDEYTTHWERIEKTQQVIAENNDNQTSIEVDIADIKNNNNRTYRCYIYKNDVLIDIAEKLVSLSIEVKEDIYVVFECDDNNDGAFLYNENGYIEVEEFLKNRRLNFTVYKDGVRLGSETANAYTYKWKLPGFNGEEIGSNDEYTPENSMITYLPCDLASSGPKDQTSLEYKIRSNFNRNYINNTITLEIIYNGTVKYFPFTFTFSKQGDPGTNGTDYQMRIIATEPGKMLQYSTSTTAISNLYYKIEFYHNGEPEALDNYDIEIKLPPQCENAVAKKDGNYVGVFNNFNLSGKIDKQETYNFVVSGSFPSAVTKTVTSADNKTTTYSFDPPTRIENYTKNILIITATPKNPKEKQFKLASILPIGIAQRSADYLYDYNSSIVFNGEGYSPSYSDASLETYLSVNPTVQQEREQWKKNYSQFELFDEVDKVEFSLLEDSDLYLIRQKTYSAPHYLKVANKFNPEEAINTLRIDDFFSFKFIRASSGAVEQRERNYTSYFPLISTINQYSLMYINEWDGNSVEIKEDEGYIYAPQIGAGHKEIDKSTGDNTFTGVIMGEYVIDHEEQGVGLWGFQNGVSTFGFRDNGSAYIGYPTGARLEFDGNNGFIQNAGFIEDKSGMQLDFVNGSIWTPSFYLDTDSGGKNNKFVFTLGEGNNSEFLIKTADNKNIFEASKAKYVLQSKNWNGSDSSTTAGLKIDLANGYLDSPYVYIDGNRGKFNLNINADNTTSQFTISAQPVINNIGQTDEYNKPIYKTIFKANDKTYWLKSLNYTGNDSDEGTETGLKIDLNKGTIDSKYVYIGGEKGKFTLNIPVDSAGSQFIIKAQPTGTDGKGKTDKNGPVYNTIFNATTNTYYLKSLNYMDDEDENSTDGLYINLKKGYIKSPNFNISSSGADFKGKITATSGDIGGWTITAPVYKKDGITIKTPGQIYSNGKQTTLYSNGDIEASGTIKLNEIQLTSDGEIKLTQGSVTSTIGLKTGVDESGNIITANETAGAMLISAPNGFAVHADGTNGSNIYMKATKSLILTVNDGTGESKITMTPTTITFSPDPQAVAVFG